MQTELQTHQPEGISIYTGTPATPMEIASETAKIAVSFPSLDKLFFTILAERLIKNNFTIDRLIAATGYLIDNFHYKQPTIADIISFDKKAKLYSYNEVVVLINENKARFEDFDKHWVGDTLYRIRKSEVEMHNLKPYLKSERSPQPFIP